ncbi:hypothetical protein T492DRAFT_844502 [Pavlovales sp. CCMP2436]|nr:hypothetical protein T492DRAFT_844502 [Pavlovales sp. CCMP2436]
MLSLRLGRDGALLPNVTSTAGGEVAVFSLPLVGGALSLDSAGGSSGVGAECAYWDEQAGATLSTTGVETVSAAEGTLLCRTFHLTDFAASPTSRARDGVLHTNDVSAEDAGAVLARGPRASLGWALAGGLNTMWIVGFLIVYCLRRQFSKRRYTSFTQHHRRKASDRANAKIKPYQRFLRRQLRYITMQHTLIRALYHTNWMHDGIQLALSAYQKICTLTLIVNFKLLAAALLYRSVKPTDGGDIQLTRLVVTALVAGCFVLPASVVMDRLFLSQQYITHARRKTRNEVSDNLLFAVAKCETFFDSIRRTQTLERWRANTEVLRVRAWLEWRHSTARNVEGGTRSEPFARRRYLDMVAPLSTRFSGPSSVRTPTRCAMVWSSLAAAAVEDSSAAAKAEITPELCSHYAALEAPAPLAGSRLRVKGPPRLVTALRKVALGSMLPAAPAPPSIAGSPSLATRPILLPRAAGDAPQFTAHSHVFKQFLHAPKPDPVSTPDACSAAFVEQFSSNDSVAPLSTSPSTPSSVRTPTRCAMVRSSSLDALTPVSTADELVSSLLPGLPLPRPARLRSCTVKSVADTTVSLRLVPVTLSLLAAGAVEDSPAATEHEGDTADSNQRQARRVRPSALLAELGRLELVDARLALEANPIEPRLLRSYPASAPQAPPPSPPPSPPLVVRRSSLQQQPQLLCRVDPWSESPNKGSSSTSTTLAEAEKIPAARQQRVCHSSLPVITLSSIVERHYAAKKGHYLPPDTPLSFHRRQTSTVVGISRNINRRSFRLSEADLVVIAKDGSILVRQIPLAPELLFRGKQGWPHELRALLGSALTRWAEQAGVDTTGGDGGAPPSGAMAIFRTAAVVARIAVRLERRSKLEKEPGWHAPTWHTRAEGSGGSVDGSS